MELSLSVGNYGAIRERLLEAAADELQRIAYEGARYAEDKAEEFARGRTPGTTYSATVESAETPPIEVTLRTNHDDDKASLLFNIANTGRRSYPIYPNTKKKLAWFDDNGDPMYRNRKSGKQIASMVIAPAIAGDDFYRRAADAAAAYMRRQA